jgi:uncharacterized protein DUF4235
VARVLFAPVGIVAGLIAGLLGRKLFESAWGLIDEEEPPDAEHRQIDWPKLIAALAIEGAIFRLVKGLVDHGTRSFFERATGTWPGEEAPEPE